MERRELKSRAKESLRNHWGQSVLIVFLFMLFQGIVSKFGDRQEVIDFMGIPITTYTDTWVSYLVTILAIPMAYGLIHYFMGIVRGEAVSVSSLFEGYKKTGSILLIQFRVAINTFLWTLLFIVPGIIKSISYSMSLYILRDNPTIGSGEAIKLSMKYMEGHKMEYFVLQLSFIGWILLSLLTLGIGVLWVVPYIQTTMCYFYEDVKTQYWTKQGAI